MTGFEAVVVIETAFHSPSEQETVSIYFMARQLLQSCASEIKWAVISVMNYHFEFSLYYSLQVPGALPFLKRRLHLALNCWCPEGEPV